MLKQSRILLAAFALCLIPSTAMRAQATTAPTPLSKFLSHIDIALNGTGVFTKATTGPVIASSATNPGQIVTQESSNTFGALFTVRATKSPWVGLEGNIGYHRFTETYSCCNLQGGAQTNAYDYSFGYVVHPPHEFFGAKPYASVGAGTTAFRPTVNGGQGLSTQARATYYYSAGVDVPAFADFFSVRLGFRQLFYLAPDFGQKYITTKQRTITSEPVIGFVFHF